LVISKISDVNVVVAMPASGFKFLDLYICLSMDFAVWCAGYTNAAISWMQNSGQGETIYKTKSGIVESPCGYAQGFVPR
jgi:hypothetical protein